MENHEITSVGRTASVCVAILPLEPLLEKQQQDSYHGTEINCLNGKDPLLISREMIHIHSTRNKTHARFVPVSVSLEIRTTCLFFCALTWAIAIMCLLSS